MRKNLFKYHLLLLAAGMFITAAAQAQTSSEERAAISATKAAPESGEKEFLLTARAQYAAKTVEEPSTIEKAGPVVAAEQQSGGTSGMPVADRRAAIPSAETAAPGDAQPAEIAPEPPPAEKAEGKVAGAASQTAAEGPKAAEPVEKTKIEVSDAVVDRELPSLRVNLKDIIRSAEQNIKRVDECLKAEERGNAGKGGANEEKMRRAAERGRAQARRDAEKDACRAKADAERQAKIEAERRRCDTARRPCEQGRARKDVERRQNFGPGKCR